METALIISNLVLWIVVVVLALTVYALIRQIGVLHERVFPVGALTGTSGPRIGEPVSPLTVTSWTGSPISLGKPSDTSVLILFVSPLCPICKTLLPLLDSVAKWESEGAPLKVLLTGDGSRSEYQGLVHEYKIDPEWFVLSRELGLQFMVDKLPFAVLIDETGVLRARGLVNSREHLESLFEARQQGVATLQEHFVREGMFDEVA